jgi:hypothetical protein
MASSALLISTLYSCQPTLKSLNSDKVPSAVGQHFQAISLDSAGFLRCEPYKYETDSFVSFFNLKVTMVGAKLKGTLEEHKFPKALGVLPVDGIKEKPFNVSLGYEICCGNHTPKDCVPDTRIAADSTRTKGCKNWKVILL